MDPDDRRAKRVHLIPKGTAHVRTAAQAAKATEQDLRVQLGEHDYQHLRRTLQTLLHTSDEPSNPAGPSIGGRVLSHSATHPPDRPQRRSPRRFPARSEPARRPGPRHAPEPATNANRSTDLFTAAERERFRGERKSRRTGDLSPDRPRQPVVCFGVRAKRRSSAPSALQPPGGVPGSCMQTSQNLVRTVRLSLFGSLDLC